MNLLLRHRITIGLCVLVLGAAAVVAVVSTRQSKPPSIVLIMVDTLRADKLGTYGSPAPASRELDEIAEHGVVFERAVSQASWTRSSIASILTGLYPRRAGVLKEQWDALPPTVTTVAEALGGRGYETIGLTANPQLNKDFRFEQGFDEYVESTVIFSWMQHSEGKVKARRDKLVRTADEMLAEAERLVSARSTSSPLYLQLLLMDVHAHHRIEPESIDDDLRAYPDSAYFQAVRHATRPLAAFIRKMDTLLHGDVVFVVTADHGEGLEDHPSVDASRGHGNLLYRSQIHVPLMFIEGSERRHFVARRVPRLTQLTDLAPTLLKLGGAEVPDGLDGSSLVPELTGEGSVPAVPAYSETQWRPGVSKTALTDGEWLYIESRDEWSGTAPRELHSFGGAQDGAKDRITDREDIEQKLRAALDARIRDQH